jgi:hypothetical protein
MKHALISLVALSTFACGGAPEPVTPTAPPAPSSASPATFADQVALGQTLYGENCGGRTVLGHPRLRPQSERHQS